MTDTKKKIAPESTTTIDYGIFGTFKVIHIETTLFNESNLEVYSKLAPIEPDPYEP